MHRRLPWLIVIALLTAVLTACTSGQSSAKSKRVPIDAPKWQQQGLSPEQRDASAREALLQSQLWLEPSCRWLAYGAWVVPDSREAPLYKAAEEAGYIEMKEAGVDTQHYTPQPAYNVALTELGTTETADCKTESYGKQVWGLPVSRRSLKSLTYTKDGAAYTDYTFFALEEEWQPTTVGERVKDVLTDFMKVQYGTWHTEVLMRRVQQHWYVEQLGEVGYYHPQPKW
jgi:hypothetical protein